MREKEKADDDVMMNEEEKEQAKKLSEDKAEHEKTVNGSEENAEAEATEEGAEELLKTALKREKHICRDMEDEIDQVETDLSALREQGSKARRALEKLVLARMQGAEQLAQTTVLVITKKVEKAKDSFES